MLGKFVLIILSWAVVLTIFFALFSRTEMYKTNNETVQSDKKDDNNRGKQT